MLLAGRCADAQPKHRANYVLNGCSLVSLDQPLRCMFCGMLDGNHLGYCVIVGDITGYNIVPHYVDDEDIAPKTKQIPATG